MPHDKREFQLFIEEEVNKLKGVYYPVRAGFFSRNFVHKLPCDRLHPNPYDEFCLPEVGPSYDIISRYERDYRSLDGSLSSASFLNSGIAQPIMVQKISPEGYMILNGHHRWAAAMRAGFKKIPVQIVNLTAERDIRQMLQRASFNKRATLDLDETVFREKDKGELERPLPFPFDRHFKERLRAGIPALFYFLRQQRYDIWVYTAKYYSLDYLRSYFRHYRIHVTGIITGTARKAPRDTDTVKELEQLLKKRYVETVHVDNDALLRTFSESADYEEYPLDLNKDSWAKQVASCLEKMEKHE